MFSLLLFLSLLSPLFSFEPNSDCGTSLGQDCMNETKYNCRALDGSYQANITIRDVQQLSGVQLDFESTLLLRYSDGSREYHEHKKLWVEQDDNSANWPPQFEGYDFSSQSQLNRPVLRDIYYYLGANLFLHVPADDNSMIKLFRDDGLIQYDIGICKTTTR